MDDWLKNRPVLQLILNGTISLVCLLIMFFIATSANDKESNNAEHKSLRNEKASLEYVNKQNSLQDFKIELKADKSLVESMDKKLDIIISKLPN